ncbi:MAG: leucine-rich repeat domain-containing protein [Parafilimonas sp.]|nr:leucine-rich repeat domain-containing protein [Parafilimonas sp.]
MKLKILLLNVLILLLSGAINSVCAQANVNDSLALVNLYDSTNGPHWNHKTNWLTGPVRTWYGVTVSGGRVTVLHLNLNNLNGIIPVSIGNLTALQVLEIGENNLRDTIPSSIGNLVQLHELFLAFNHLKGKLPASIGNLINLTTAYVGNNKLTGGIPASIGSVTSLVTFTAVTNNLTDSLPASLGNLTNLTDLELSHNQIKGSIPSSLGNLTKLAILDLSYNNLTGSIPSSLSNLGSIDLLSLGHNKLSGSIPSAIGTQPYPHIEVLDFSYNRLSGSIPSSFGNMSNINYIQLNDNNLTGNIPAELGNLTRLDGLFLTNNRLTGKVPNSFGHLQNLSDLYLDSNQLSGALQVNYSNLPNLANLYIDHNHFTFANNDPILVGYPDMNGDFGYNNFTFDGIEHLATQLPNVSYTPQFILHIHQNAGVLSVSAGGTLSNNTYKWFKVGETTAVTITGDSTFHPAGSGSYYAQITNAVATALTLHTDTIAYAAPVLKQNMIAKLSLFPNPAADIITVKGLNANMVSTISITDISGNTRMTIQSHVRNCTINITTLPRGNYKMLISDGVNTYNLAFIKE